ncbi:MAG: ATP-binding protein [Bacillota bacterium]
MSRFDLIKINFLKIERLVVYRNILYDDLISNIRELVLSLNSFTSEKHTKMYYDICYELINKAEQHNFEGDLLSNYILTLVLTDENPFTFTAEKKGSNINCSLFQAALRDIDLLKEILGFKLTDLGEVIGPGELNFISDYQASDKKKNSLNKNLNKLKTIIIEYDSEEVVNFLSYFYKNSGSGNLCQYSSFFWDDEKKMVGVNNLDTITFDDIIGYEEQKQQLIENTESFLRGFRSNNVLLYGESGTGKSSSIKALINEYSEKGLRLVEIYKEQIKSIPKMLEELRKRGLYFIIYMDDLSFEDFETDYKYLKAIMEGGIEGKPTNVLFYATTNKRHIIKEKWDDRNFSDVHSMDTQEEILSLSERFGVTITYLSPDQEQYLDIVKKLAAQNNIEISEKKLIDKALKWEKWHHGRSGRTARQFVNYIISK